MRLAMTTFFFAFFAAQEFMQWPLVKYWTGAPIGSGTANDLRLGLKLLECYGSLPLNVFFTTAIYEACPENLYGLTAAFIVSITGLSSAATVYITWSGFILMAGIFGGLAESTYRRFGLVPAAIAVLLVTSPPIQFLLERGNFDIAIFLLTFVGAWAVSKGATPLAVLTLSLAASIKFYSVFAVGAIALWARTRRGSLLVLLVQFMLALILAIELLGRQGTIKIPADGGGSFGLTVLPQIWNIAFERGIVNLFIPEYLMLPMGLVALVPCFALLLFQDHRTHFTATLIRSKTNSDMWSIFGIISGVVFASCYFAGTNFDYRMVFLVPFGLWVLTGLEVHGFFRWVLTLTLLASFWVSFVPGPFQVFGDVCIALWAALGIYLLAMCLLSLIFDKVSFMRRKTEK